MPNTPAPHRHAAGESAGPGAVGGSSRDPSSEHRKWAPAPSRRSQRGLDWFVFGLADVQSGFGPFISVYLTGEKWTQSDIGYVLTAGALTALLGQMPGGAVVDAARSERAVAAVAVLIIATSALALAAWPVFGIVLTTQMMHAAASCTLGPVIAAISLGLVGYSAVGERLGRNARFAALGAGLAAAGMGACGYFFSSRAVFLMTAALCGPTLVALYFIRSSEIDPERAHGGRPRSANGRPADALRELATNRHLRAFACCILLFHLANAAILPQVARTVTLRSSEWATVLVGACIVVPQIVVVLLAPTVGRMAQRWGRRPLLLLGFAALPLRGFLLAFVNDPVLLVATQILDGIAGSVLAILVPLTIADMTRGSGHFNLAQGAVGTCVGIGAAASTTLAGHISDAFGNGLTFSALGGIGAVAFLLVLARMPETQPSRACSP